MDDVGAVPPSLGHHPARCPDIPGGLRQGTGGRQRTRRIVDENLRDLLSAPDQQRALTLDDLVLASGDPVPVVHLQNAHLTATTRRQVALDRPPGDERHRLGQRCCPATAQLGHKLPP
jgi:hypothetical protein